MSLIKGTLSIIEIHHMYDVDITCMMWTLFQVFHLSTTSAWFETFPFSPTDPAEVPVSQDLVPLNNRAGIQQMLREQLTRLENTYRERTERIKQVENRFNLLC